MVRLELNGVFLDKPLLPRRLTSWIDASVFERSETRARCRATEIGRHRRTRARQNLVLARRSVRQVVEADQTDLLVRRRDGAPLVIYGVRPQQKPATDKAAGREIRSSLQALDAIDGKPSDRLRLLDRPPEYRQLRFTSR